MYNCALEVFDARDIGLERSVIIIISGREDHEFGLEVFLLAIDLYCERPLVV